MEYDINADVMGAPVFVLYVVCVVNQGEGDVNTRNLGVVQNETIIWSMIIGSAAS